MAPSNAALFDVPLIVLSALLIRWLVSLWGYSGKGTPPVFGDYEAQRHWMEVTTNLPLGQWYFYDLSYWGLDYPPLTAYVSWACGVVSASLEPASMALGASRGYETDTHKAFMRFSVLFFDLLVFFPAAWHLSRKLPGGKASATARFALVLCQPGLLLIDHGHFQYNNVSVGFALGGAAALLENHDLAASVLFCLSLNFKQMSLYYAPVFFVHLLAQCARSPTPVRHFMLIGSTVVGTFGCLWAPFCVLPRAGSTCIDSTGQILQRLFPFNRGLFEDKVANFWYVLSIPVDLREQYDVSTLKLLSLGATILLLSPVLVDLFRRGPAPMPRRLLLALHNSALAFFLCAFQVHEKSILLPLAPLAFLVTDDPLFVGWIAIVATFSMHPLLTRDGLSIPYAACIAAFLLALWAFGDNVSAESPMAHGTRGATLSPTFLKVRRVVVAASAVGMVALHALHLTVAPPARYPDIYPLLFAVFSFGHFMLAYVYCVAWQWSSREVESMALRTNTKAE
jgi:alpha-1,3-glucosyltransferase